MKELVKPEKKPLDDEDDYDDEDDEVDKKESSPQRNMFSNPSIEERMRDRDIMLQLMMGNMIAVRTEAQML